MADLYAARPGTDHNILRVISERPRGAAYGLPKKQKPNLTRVSALIPVAEAWPPSINP